jgi:hypothetical protein
MKLHKTREATKILKILHSPLTPYLYSPYLSAPLATINKKETKPEAERKDPAVR